MLSKWRSKRKCDCRWPASVRLPAKKRRSPIAVACLSNGSFSLGNSRKSRVRQVKLGDVALSTSQSVVQMPSTASDSQSAAAKAHASVS